MRGLMARVEDERMTLSICIIQAILQKWIIWRVDGLYFTAKN